MVLFLGNGIKKLEIVSYCEHPVSLHQVNDLKKLRVLRLNYPTTLPIIFHHITNPHFHKFSFGEEKFHSPREIHQLRKELFLEEVS